MRRAVVLEWHVVVIGDVRRERTAAGDRRVYSGAESKAMVVSSSILSWARRTALVELRPSCCRRSVTAISSAIATRPMVQTTIATIASTSVKPRSLVNIGEM